MSNKVHNTIGGGAGILGGILLYINSHLGTAFYALILLVFLNVIAAMWTRDLRQAINKWINVVMGVAIPFVVPLFAKSQDIGWSTDNTKTLVGLIFGALLSATIPDILAFVSKVMNAIHVPQKEQAMTLEEIQAELVKLAAQNQPQQAAKDQSHNTPLNPEEKGTPTGA